MNFITTTQLRTKSKELVKSLEEGYSVKLVHRSKVIGEIKPKIHEPKPFNSARFLKTIKKLNFSPLSLDEIDKKYREAMTKKHG